jgi:hypothetical protein
MFSKRIAPEFAAFNSFLPGFAIAHPKIRRGFEGNDVMPVVLKSGDEP